MNPHRVGKNSLEPYKSSESSPKQSKNADMDQTGYAIEKFGLVLTFPPVTISWVKAVKAYGVSFYRSKIFLDQSKNF